MEMTVFGIRSLYVGPRKHRFSDFTQSLVSESRFQNINDQGNLRWYESVINCPVKFKDFSISKLKIPRELGVLYPALPYFKFERVVMSRERIFNESSFHIKG